MPVTNPVNSQLCDITDLARDVYNLMVRMAELESRQNQLINSNVTTVYLSDFSPDAGSIIGGTLGPLVIINTIQDYAMYTYQYEGGQLEVTSPIIEITRNEGNVPDSILTSALAKRFINFKVHKDGVYHFSLGANIRLGGYPFSVNAANLSYAVELHAGTLPSLSNPTNHGYQLHGQVLEYHKYVPADVEIFAGGDPLGGGVDLSGFTESDYLRLTAEDEVHMVFAPELKTSAVVSSPVEIENINVILRRVSDL